MFSVFLVILFLIMGYENYKLVIRIDELEKEIKKLNSLRKQ